MNANGADANRDQHALWNGPAGDAWVEAQALLDGMFAPFETLLVQAARERGARRVLDVGCGTGATTLALARALGEGARCVGIDLSAPMLELARARAARPSAGGAAEFVLGDAQRHGFAPGSFDAIVSRFGVMFFDDPVLAFANLLRAASPGGGLQLIAWRSPADNPFMTAAERAAAPYLPELPPRRADAPGQFAFADARRVRRLLEDAGWTQVALAPLDVECGFPAADLDRYLGRIGPVGLALRDAGDELRRQVVEAVRAAFQPYLRGPEVRFTAACWNVTATA